MSIMRIKRGDTHPQFRLTQITDTTGAALATAGATARLLLVDLRGTPAANPITGTLTTEAGGTTYTAALPALDPGVYHAEVEVSYATGERVTLPARGYYTVSVEQDLG